MNQMNSNDEFMLKNMKRDVNKILSDENIDVSVYYETEYDTQDMILQIDVEFKVPEKNFCMLNDELSDVHQIINELTNGEPMLSDE